MSRPKWINVVITAYQHEMWVRQAIDSVLNQTYGYIKNIFVIDDSSTDNTYNILSSYGDRRIEVFRNSENKGVSYSANTVTNLAASNAEVDYIALLSADDVWTNEKLSRQVDFLENNPKYDIVFSDCATIDENGNLSPRMSIFDFQNTDRFGWIFKLFLKNWFVASSALIRRAVWRDVGPYDVRLRQIQDWKLWIASVSRGYEIHIIEEALVFYRCHSGSISNNESPEKNARLLCEIPKCLEAFRSISLGDLKLVFAQDLAGSDLFQSARSVDVGLAVLASKVNSRPHHQFAANVMSDYYLNHHMAGLIKDKDYHEFIGNLRL